MDYFHSLTTWLTDLIFPAHCLGCSCVGNHLCRPCANGLRTRSYQECIVCKRPSATGAPCVRCQTHTMVDRLLIAGHADDELLMRAIHGLKYQYLTGLAHPLADWTVTALALRHITRTAFHTNPLIVPVPLHPRRFAERGFNQSELIAHQIASTIAMPYAPDILRRTRNTASQVKTGSRWERIDNMKDAFACTKPELVTDRDIILIDDVCTTGATLDACAHTLKQNGARSVSAIVLARG